ncbi:MAG: endonuclease V, partial [Nitrospinota bacterium]
IASHLGLRLGVPSVGCAKSRLWGEAADPPDEKGAWSPLREKEGKVVGGLLRTRKGVKPVYISPGHRIDLEGAIRIALASSPHYRIPAAHPGSPHPHERRAPTPGDRLKKNPRAEVRGLLVILGIPVIRGGREGGVILDRRPSPVFWALRRP